MTTIDGAFKFSLKSLCRRYSLEEVALEDHDTYGSASRVGGVGFRGTVSEPAQGRMRIVIAYHLPGVDRHRVRRVCIQMLRPRGMCAASDWGALSMTERRQ
jgi:hypothetical protein